VRCGVGIGHGRSAITAKHLIMSLGEKAFLALPKRGRLCVLPTLHSIQR
jgi:hypothetical protein